MQRITIADIKTKMGTNVKGDWTLVIVKDDKGAEYTSFDKTLVPLTQGSIIEVETEITAKDGKTKVNITSWKLIESKPVSPTPPIPVPTATDTMSKEEWAEKDRIKQLSIESQVAFTGTMEHLNAWLAASEGKADLRPLTPALEKLQAAAYQWALQRLTPPTTSQTFETQFPKKLPPAPPKAEYSTRESSQTTTLQTKAPIAKISAEPAKIQNMGEFRMKAANLGYKTEAAISAALEKPLATVGDLDKALKDLLILKGK